MSESYNRVIVVGKPVEGEDRAPTATADNTDDRDPSSIPRRGYVRARPPERLDTDDQAVMQAHADMLLANEMRHTRTFVFQHRWMWLPMHAAVHLQTTTGVDVVGTVIKKSWPVSPTSLVTTTIREVPQ